MTDAAALFREAICSYVEARSLEKDVTEILTPFLDWKGARVSVYMRASGEITDGGETLSELRSLRVHDDWAEWPFRADFLERYCMREVDEALVATYPENPQAVLRYAQGVARLAQYFDAKPITQRADVFPEFVKSQVRPLVEALAPVPPDERPMWASARLGRKKWLHSGIAFYTDLSPLQDRLMVQIVSYSSAQPSTQRSHVSEKVLPYALLRGDKEHQNISLVTVVGSLEDYGPQARALLETESKRVFETAKDQGAWDKVARLISIANPPPELLA